MKRTKPSKLPTPDPPDVRLAKCAAEIQRILLENGCQMYAAIQVGTVHAPITEIAGFPIVVKLSLQ